MKNSPILLALVMLSRPTFAGDYIVELSNKFGCNYSNMNLYCIPDLTSFIRDYDGLMNTERIDGKVRLSYTENPITKNGSVELREFLNFGMPLRYPDGKPACTTEEMVCLDSETSDHIIDVSVDPNKCYCPRQIAYDNLLRTLCASFAVLDINHDNSINQKDDVALPLDNFVTLEDRLVYEAQK